MHAFAVKTSKMRDGAGARTGENHAEVTTLTERKGL